MKKIYMKVIKKDDVDLNNYDNIYIEIDINTIASYDTLCKLLDTKVLSDRQLNSAAARLDKIYRDNMFSSTTKLILIKIK